MNEAIEEVSNSEMSPMSRPYYNKNFEGEQMKCFDGRERPDRPLSDSE